MRPVSLLQSSIKYTEIKQTDNYAFVAIKAPSNIALKIALATAEALETFIRFVALYTIGYFVSSSRYSNWSQTAYQSLENFNQTCRSITQFSAPNDTSKRPLEKLKRVFWITLGVWTTYNLIDLGLARFLGLETLIHGTGPLGYIGIAFNGADPSFGGGDTGSTLAARFKDMASKAKNYFHVFKDSEIPGSGFKKHLIYSPKLTLLAKYHAVLSGMGNFGYSKADGRSRKVRAIVGSIFGFLTPTLKFRFKPEEVLNCSYLCRFDNDPFYYGFAYRTKQAISPKHLGITGSLTQGIDSRMFSRMSNNREKVLFGAALLGTAFLVARATYDYIKAEPIKKDVSISNKENLRQQHWKKKAKVIAVKSCWAAVATTTIFFNTV